MTGRFEAWGGKREERIVEASVLVLDFELLPPARSSANRPTSRVKELRSPQALAVTRVKRGDKWVAPNEYLRHRCLQ